MKDDEKKKSSTDEGNVMTMDEINDKIAKMDGNESQPQKVETPAPAQNLSPVKSVSPQSALSPAQAAGVDTDADADADAYGYGKILSVLRDSSEQSAKDEEKQRKRERRDMLVRSLGDGISAIAGLVGSVNGAPNTVNHERSLTKAGIELRDKIRKEREEKRDLYTRRALAAARIDAENKRTQSLAEKAKQSAELAKYKAEGAHEVAIRKLELAENKEEFEQKRKEALLQIKQQEADTDAEYKAGMLSVAEYNAETNRLRAQSDRIRAMKYTGGSGGSGGSESASEWMFRTQDEDPEGYREAVKGALGYEKPNPTSREAGQIRAWYNAYKKKRNTTQSPAPAKPANKPTQPTKPTKPANKPKGQSGKVVRRRGGNHISI